ncbi:zinc ribbon domain-containing protein [Stomatohabitans albus]|uniref:zinc ribbon domain-containing protein n=1 Tax=Stomatohabitans albus TaxID=3110766 RepID=UPI00300C372E
MRVTPQQQRSLAHLSTIDERLRRLNHTRDHLEAQQRLDAHQQQFDQATSELVDTVGQLEKAEATNRRLENEISAVTASQKAADAQLYSGALTTEKQVQAVKDELAAMKKRKHDLEDSQLETMEEIEGLETTKAKLTETRTQLSTEIDTLTGLRNEASADIDADIEGAREQRVRVVAELTEEIITEYERHAKRSRGPVVASLDNRTCLGCHMELPGVDIEELRQGMRDGELVACPECDTLLVPAPD